MNALSLMYHDVVAAGEDDTSGFPGPWPALYKLTETEFVEHLDAIANAVGSRASRIDTPPWPDNPVFLTFDDGGISAVKTSQMLEERGWRGHFFITTDYVGKPGFLNATQIRDLHLRGHCIGSHSCSHPTRMSACSGTELDHEWMDSVARLANILGEPVVVASVPGGYYSRKVAEAAFQAGIRYLFNSEPTARVNRTRECLVLGRYHLKRGFSSATAAGFAGGARLPRLKQSALWTCKKIAKGPSSFLYLSVAQWIRRRA